MQHSVATKLFETPPRRVGLACRGKALVLYSLVFFSFVLASIGYCDTLTPKLVYLVVEEDKLVVSNIKFNRFDEYKLGAKEEIQQQAVGNAVVIVVTNQRILGYSVYRASWRARNFKANEEVLNVEAEDYSGMVITNKRYLGFNGKTATWSENQR
jgi:hypothetical protein